MSVKCGACNEVEHGDTSDCLRIQLAATQVRTKVAEFEKQRDAMTQTQVVKMLAERTKELEFLREQNATLIRERDEALSSGQGYVSHFGSLVRDRNAAEQQVAALRVALEKIAIIANRCDDAGSEYWQAGLIAKNALAATVPLKKD